MLVKGGGLRRKAASQRGPAGRHSASLPHGGATARTESHLRVQGCGGHGKNMLIAFPKEPTAHVERRKGTPAPSNHAADSL